MCSAMLFKYSIHIFLFLNLIILTEGVDKTDLRDEDAWILSRQITHLSHQMALREDGTTMIVGKDDNPKLKILPASSPLNAQRDRVFWRDWNYQFQDRSDTRDIDEFTKYLLTKNVHRKLLYAGDEICNKTTTDGVRFKQTFHEPLLPEEMQCYTCDRALLPADHLLSFHVIPSRVFFNANGTLIKFAERKEEISSAPAKSSRYPLFGELINKYTIAQFWNGGDAKPLPVAQILQYFGGSQAEFDEKYSSLVEERNIAWVQAPPILVRSAMLFSFYTEPDTTNWKKLVHEYDNMTEAVTHDYLHTPSSWRSKRAASAYSFISGFNSETSANERLTKTEKRARKDVWRSYGNGKTVQCAREVNNQLVPLDVILNVDTVVFDDLSTEWHKAYQRPDISKPSTKRPGGRKKRATPGGQSHDQFFYRFNGNFYGVYENWKSEWVPPNVTSSNLKLDVAWEPFSCCSACCCSIEMCGLYATVHKCANIRSSKTRKGYLSLMKLDPTKEIKLTVQRSDLVGQQLRNKHLIELMNRYPYSEKGIPVHSSMLIDYRQEPNIQKLLEEFDEMRTNNLTDTDDLLNHTPGIYVQEVTCDNDEQKLDCHKLAECRGIQIEKKKDVVAEELEQEDPCDTEDELQILTISAEQNYFRMNEGDSYRFRLDTSVFDTRTVKWKISQKAVPDYNVNIKCLEQRRARHPDGRDLLFTKLTIEDTNRRIEARLDNNKPLLIVLNNNKEIDKYSANTTKVIIWGIVILGVVLLLMVFIVVVDRVRKRRIERVLQKKNKRLNEDDIVDKPTTPLKGSSATTAIEPSTNNNVTKTE